MSIDIHGLVACIKANTEFPKFNPEEGKPLSGNLLKLVQSGIPITDKSNGSRFLTILELNYQPELKEELRSNHYFRPDVLYMSVRDDNGVNKEYYFNSGTGVLLDEEIPSQRYKPY